MEQLDYFYRAFKDYKANLEGNREDHLFKKASQPLKKDPNYISKIKVECKIDEDWINEIESKVVYLEKCIKEDRQFIRNEGEVLPIEKIRRVSKESISDLAKHSDYITKLPDAEQENVLPEKLLMISREIDYKIYENRVLYACLSFLRDFIATKLDKIEETVNKYEGKVFVRKNVVLVNRTVDFTLELNEKRLNDPIAMANSKIAKLVERIKLMLNDIMVLLKTPLMLEVAKAPMVTRPITKTNVLKMNINFKEMLAVYDYACAYDKPGYEIIESEEMICPLNQEQNDAFVDIIELSSFLGYEYNNHLEEKLRVNYLEEEKRRKKEQEDEMLKRLDEMMKNALEKNSNIKEYLYLLENGYKVLTERVEELKAEITNIVEKHEQEIAELNQKHQEEIDDLKRDAEERMSELRFAHEEELNQMRAQFEAEKAQMINDYDARIANLENKVSTKQAYIFELKGIVSNCQNEVAAIKEAATVEIEQIHKSYEDAITLKEAELTAIRTQDRNPPLPSEFKSKDRFLQLEKEKEAFDKLYKASWVEAKREIRNSYFKRKASEDVEEIVKENEYVDSKEAEALVKTKEEQESVNKVIEGMEEITNPEYKMLKEEDVVLTPENTKEDEVPEEPEATNVEEEASSSETSEAQSEAINSEEVPTSEENNEVQSEAEEALEEPTKNENNEEGGLDE